MPLIAAHFAALLTLDDHELIVAHTLALGAPLGALLVNIFAFCMHTHTHK